jgi:CheY-like chemotaxis protein
MAFECLLVSPDPAVFCTVDRILRDLSVSTSVCLSSSKALALLAEGGTDLFVIDWEGENSSELLHKIWNLRKQKPTVVAVSTQDGPIPGVHVVLRKPVTAESGTKSLKVAYSRMLIDHRRHARHAIMTAVQATDNNNRILPVMITDIGDGGLGLCSKEKLEVGHVLSFRVLLHGAKREIYLQARVLWIREYGKAGCEFVRIPPVDRNIFQDWLTSKIHVKKPLVVL